MLVGRLNITLLTLLGRGAFGDVYLARLAGDGGFERRVAVKRLRPEVAQDLELVRAFTREARICGLLSHPNLIQVFGFTESPEGHLLIMELLDGIELRQLLHDLREVARLLPVGVALEIARQVSEGLAFAHDACGPGELPLGLVHRDIKPANVMVTVGGLAKIMDFGIARSATCLSVSRTEAETIKGTLRYMSPEQARGCGDDPRIDQFAVGLLLTEMLIGRPVYDEPSLARLLATVQAGRVDAALAEVEGSFPAALPLLQRALAVDPTERFPHAADLAQALQELLRASPLSPSALGRFVRDHRRACAEREAALLARAIDASTAVEAGALLSLEGLSSGRESSFFIDLGDPLEEGSGRLGRTEPIRDRTVIAWVSQVALASSGPRASPAPLWAGPAPVPFPTRDGRTLLPVEPVAAAGASPQPEPTIFRRLDLEGAGIRGLAGASVASPRRAPPAPISPPRASAWGMLREALKRAIAALDRLRGAAARRPSPPATSTTGARHER